MEKIGYLNLIFILRTSLEGTPLFNNIIVNENFEVDQYLFVRDGNIDRLKKVLMSFYLENKYKDQKTALIYRQTLDKLINYGTEVVSENIILYLKTGKWGLAEKVNRPVAIKDEAVGLSAYLLAEHG